MKILTPCAILGEEKMKERSRYEWEERKDGAKANIRFYHRTHWWLTDSYHVVCKFFLSHHSLKVDKNRFQIAKLKLNYEAINLYGKIQKFHQRSLRYYPFYNSKEKQKIIWCQKNINSLDTLESWWNKILKISWKYVHYWNTFYICNGNWLCDF